MRKGIPVGDLAADWFFITDSNAARNSDTGHDRFYTASGLLNLQDTLSEALTSRDSGPVCLKLSEPSSCVLRIYDC